MLLFSLPLLLVIKQVARGANKATLDLLQSDVSVRLSLILSQSLFKKRLNIVHLFLFFLTREVGFNHRYYPEEIDL